MSFIVCFNNGEDELKGKYECLDVCDVAFGKYYQR